jgi:transposase-like protein
MDFQERFASEAACLEYLAVSRWPEGFRCPGCEGRDAWVLERRHLWECASCHRQTSVTAGTVMHGTRSPLRLWFWAAYLVATHHPGISAKQLQRQLGIRYATAWLILQKLRRAMVAPERGLLTVEVEVDECWIGGVERGKQGRGPGQKTLVGVSVEVRGQGSGRLGLAPLTDAAKPTLSAFVKATTAPGVIVHTDGWKGYNGLPSEGYRHQPRSQRSAVGEEPFLPRAHRAISKPQGLAARHPPGRLPRTPRRLPRRIRLSPQPTPHPNGRLPNPARTRRPPPSQHLQPDHTA